MDPRVKLGVWQTVGGWPRVLLGAHTDRCIEHPLILHRNRKTPAWKEQAESRIAGPDGSQRRFPEPLWLPVDGAFEPTWLPLDHKWLLQVWKMPHRGETLKQREIDFQCGSLLEEKWALPTSDGSRWGMILNLRADGHKKGWRYSKDS